MVGERAREERVGRREEREEEEEDVTKELEAGMETREERRGRGAREAPEGGGEEREGREELGATRECDRWGGGGSEGNMGVEVREEGRVGVERGVARGGGSIGRKEEETWGLLQTGEAVESGRWRDEEERDMGCREESC